MFTKILAIVSQYNARLNDVVNRENSLAAPICQPVRVLARVYSNYQSSEIRIICYVSNAKTIKIQGVVIKNKLT